MLFSSGSPLSIPLTPRPAPSFASYRFPIFSSFPPLFQSNSPFHPCKQFYTLFPPVILTKMFSWPVFLEVRSWLPTFFPFDIRFEPPNPNSFLTPPVPLASLLGVCLGQGQLDPTSQPSSSTLSAFLNFKIISVPCNPLFPPPPPA